MPPPHIRKPKPEEQKPRKLSMRLPIALMAIMLSIIAALNLPDNLNPFAPLDPNTPPTAITPLQLSRTASNPQACLVALELAEGLTFQHLDDLSESKECHIRPRVSLRAISGTNLRPVQTSCSVALRLFMWNRHVVQPAAQAHFGMQVAGLQHFDSYSCRHMRTSQGTSSQMSAHATASAIDVSGFRLENGTEITLLNSWDDDQTQAFWREVRNGACTWFRTVLSPDYNSLHANHFHLAQGRWMSCR